MDAAAPPGRVESREEGLRWRVIFPDVEHIAASSYLRELAASDCGPATIRSYAYALLRWFRFLHERFLSWDRAERIDVRASSSTCERSRTRKGCASAPTHRRWGRSTPAPARPRWTATAVRLAP
jgi:hypothetical protein